MSYPWTERRRRFAQLAEELAAPIGARAELIDHDNTFPVENFRDLHAVGYLALTIPEAYGGQGANVLEYALAIRPTRISRSTRGRSPTRCGSPHPSARSAPRAWSRPRRSAPSPASWSTRRP